jgi:hypothetical protein
MKCVIPELRWRLCPLSRNELVQSNDRHGEGFRCPAVDFPKADAALWREVSKMGGQCENAAAETTRAALDCDSIVGDAIGPCGEDPAMRHAVLSLLLVAATPAGAAALDCVSTPGLAVDADGAPDSYRVDGKGLSFTCDGVFAVVNGVVHSRPACAENPIWEVPHSAPFRQGLSCSSLAINGRLQAPRTA